MLFNRWTENRIEINRWFGHLRNVYWMWIDLMMTFFSSWKPKINIYLATWKWSSDLAQMVTIKRQKQDQIMFPSRARTTQISNLNFIEVTVATIIQLANRADARRRPEFKGLLFVRRQGTPRTAHTPALHSVSNIYLNQFYKASFVVRALASAVACLVNEKWMLRK